MALQKAMVSSKDNTWETPWRFFNELDKEFNFTLDPCAQDETAKCKKYYTIETNGLDKDWSKDIVFMNPPYGGHTPLWIKKALDESRKGATVVCLIVSNSDRSYWHDYIFPFASEIRFIRGRLKFGNSNTTAPFASAVVIFDSKNEGRCKITYYSESINKRWSREDKYRLNAFHAQNNSQQSNNMEEQQEYKSDPASRGTDELSEVGCDRDSTSNSADNFTYVVEEKQ